MGPSLVTAFPALAGEHYGTGAKSPMPPPPGLRESAPRRAERAQISDSGRCIAGQGLFKPGNAFLDASRSRVDMPHTGQRDNSSHNFAILTAIRRASSLLSNFAAAC